MFKPETKVLIVDDMMTMRKLVKRACEGLGFKNFVEAGDGVQAWAAITSAADTDPIQLIISDWNMPNMPGIELLKKVRSDVKFKALPFLLVTAESEKNQIIEAIQSGVNGYVVKPFTADTLGVKLREIHKRLAAG